ncbi:DUF4347 domain-containing protein [Marinobacterium rhizophilum]|uniref:DUF4347 domain-containing protein n=1 Tax=Marinobacterium rhizophilum TaxID=420402 RepID=UPI00035DC3AB|nr:DUF4347 domain-containing protein [Marinobacterium rhizophilum]
MKWFGRSGNTTVTSGSERLSGVSSPLAMALEPRMLFDGAIAATVAETADASTQPTPVDDTSTTLDSDIAPAAASSDNRQEIVFIDTQVQDYQQLLAGLPADADVVMFGASADGLQVIADTLAGREGIDAIHILSHGDSGQVKLGNDWLDSADISTHSYLLSAIGQSLSEDGDILLYGCNVGSDGVGFEFIQSLAGATGADIAASSNLTGTADRGGDWELEVTQGSIETPSFDLSNYSGLLIAFSDSLDTDVGLEVTSFISNLGGVDFTYTFTSDGGSGDFVWDNNGNGESGSASVTLRSGDLTESSTELVTIARADATDFTFSSLYINNSGGTTVTVGGYLGGVLVSSAKTAINGFSGTLSFDSIGVDEVRISSTDFFLTNIDSFSGDTAPPAPPPAPTITSATYNASTGTLVVTGSDLQQLSGASNDIDASLLTLTGEGGSTYTLTDTSDVEIDASTQFTLTLSATDKAAFNLIANKNGATSTSGTAFNLAAADDWNASVTSGDTSDTTGNGIIVSNVAVPTITSATYDASTGSLVVTGSGFLSASGATNDIVANKFSIRGEGGTFYTLTDTANVEVTSGTAFTLTLSATDKAGVNLIVNKNGGLSTDISSYRFTAADDWAAGADAALNVTDSLSPFTASNVAIPAITSATYDASTGVLAVTGTGFLSRQGATNDIVANKFTLTGEGGSTHTLTDTANVEVNSGTSFTLTLSATDKAALNQIINKNGTSSTGATTYNLAAAEDWAAGADAAVNVVDATGNGITVSNVAVPTITSATYDASTGALVVTGTGLLKRSGSSNDIDASLFTLTGEGGSTYTLTDTSDVEITSGTSFTLTLSATDKAALQAIINKNGTSSTDTTTYNLAAAEDWNTGADAAVNIVDASGNGITVSNFNAAPVISNLNGDSVSYVEGAGSVLLDSGSNATLSDADSTDFNGGNLTVTITSGENAAEDLLSLTTSGTVSLAGTTAGSNVSVAGTVIGTLGNNIAAGNDLVVNFNANATPSHIQVLVRALSYQNSDTTDPTTGARIVRVTVSDGDGGTSANADVTVNVTGVNDAPTLTATGNNPAFIEGGAAADLFSTVSISTVESGQNLSGLTLTVTNLANGSDEILNIDGTQVVLTHGTNGTTAGSSLSYSVAVTGTTATVSLSGGSLSAAATQTLVDNMSYQNNSNTPSSSRVVTLTSLQDSGGTANGGVDTASLAIASTVTVVDVNDEPTLTANASNPPFTEGGAAASLFSGTSINTVEAGQTITGLSFTITNVTNGSNERINVDGTTIVLTHGTNGSTAGNSLNYSVMVIGTTATVTMTGGNLSVDVAETLVDNMSYQNNSDTPSTSNRVVTLTSIQDSGGTANGGDNTASLAIASTVTVVGVNDEPTLTATGTDPTYTENGSAVDLFSGVSIDTIEAGQNIFELTLTVANLADGSDEILRADGTDIALIDGNTSVTADNGMFYSVSVAGNTALVELRKLGGISNAAALTLVDGLSYRNASENPNTANRVVTLTGITDDGGTANGGDDTASLAITSTVAVTPVNDAPTLTATGTNPTYIEGAAAVDLFDGVAIDTIEAGQTITALELTLSNVFDGSNEVLDFNDAVVELAGISSGNAVTFIYDFTSLGGISVAQVQTLLDNITYRNTSEDPTAGDRVMTITLITDNGGTANGGADTANLAITSTVTVTAVNDAPVNSVPAAQSTDQNQDLVFSGANGNAITISDSDAGSGTVRVSLTASNGLLTLSSTAGLSFISGTGSNDASLSIEGSLADINTALDGLTFTPTPGYNGAASLQIDSNDLGLSGSGGAQIDSDSIAITVNSINPEVTTVHTTTADGSYKIGDIVSVTVTFDRVVNVDTTVGSPTLLLETGTTDRQATYSTGSGTNTLTFSYTVQAGDISPDLDYQSTGALTLNGATIKSAANEDALLALPATGGVNSLAGQHDLVIDGIAPAVTSVGVPANGTYVAGQNLDFSVIFDDSVVIDTAGGTPRLAVILDTGGTVYADYVSGSGTSALLFRLTVAGGQLDTNGVTLDSSIELNGSTLRDAAGNDAGTTLNSVGSTTGVLVDGIAPSAVSISVFQDDVLASKQLSFELVFDEDVSGVDLSDFTLLGSGTAVGTLDSVQQIDGQTYRVLVSGIEGNGSLTLALNAAGSGIVDTAGNNLATGLTGPDYAIATLGGDPEFLTSTLGSDPARTSPAAPAPAVPATPLPFFDSPLQPPTLFEQPTLGSGIPTLGTIFINNGVPAPSYIAQVFASSNTGAGDSSAVGFLGFGGGDAGVFGQSTLSNVFGSDTVPEPAPQLELELPTIFGAPTLGQQLQKLQDTEQDQIDTLAWALGQVQLVEPNA